MGYDELDEVEDEEFLEVVLDDDVYVDNDVLEVMVLMLDEVEVDIALREVERVEEIDDAEEYD